jgi:hypothetical protein
MSSVMEVLPYSPDFLETIVSEIKGQSGKKLANEIISCFDKAGLTVKVKQLFPNKPNSYCRVLCFIQKSREAVIINTKTDCGTDGVVEGMNIQVRIENKNTFDKINEFNGNVCSQFLNANDCRYCSTKCEGKRYTFSFNGKDYVKCQFLCSNFRFVDIKKDDIPHIMDIINGEINFKEKKRKIVL